MVIQHSSQQIVSSTDSMEVTGKMQVNIFHRNYLGIAAACSAALYTKDRSQGWFTQCHYSVLANLTHTICQANSCGGLAFSGRSRSNGRNQHQLAIRFVNVFQ